jgi:hypothetical protein
VLRFDDCDVWVTPKIFDIEGQEMGNAIGFHGGNESGVMDLGTDDGLSDDDLSPFMVGGKAIWKEAKVPLDHSCPSFCFGRGEAKAPTSRRRARRDAPKSSQDLRGIAKDFASCAEFLNSLQGQGPGWVVASGEPEKNVRIKEIGHLVVVSIDVVAGEIWGKRGNVFCTFGKLLNQGVKVLFGHVCQGVFGAAKSQEDSEICIDREPLRRGAGVKHLSGFGGHVFENWVHRHILP